MADAVSTLLSFPPDDASNFTPKKYDDAISKYIKTVEKLPSTTWTRTVEKKNILEFINPETNSIPYLFALYEQVKAAGKDAVKLDELSSHALIYYSTFDPVQVRYVGTMWTQLLMWLADTVLDLSPITNAMLRLDHTAGTFTTMHLRLLNLALHRGLPSQALPILDKNVYAFPAEPQKNVPEDYLSEESELSNTYITTKTGFCGKLKSEHILEYYLLGAHVYIGLRNWSRARLFLEYVILTPGQQHSVSALQVEAYKKWVLVGLLAQGKAYPLPATHDGSVMKSIRAVAKPYDALSDTFEKRDFKKYQAEMDVGTQVWHEDGNLRLVREAGDALLRYRVVDLQKTYAALPISRVAAHLGFAVDATLTLVTDMVRHGSLHASITPGNTAGDAVLRFHLNAAAPATSTQDNELEAQTKRIEDLVAFVRDADRRLQLTKEYVEYQKRQKRTGPDADLADQMDLTWDNPINIPDDDGDEDLMDG
jgi:COP9 signalosome complex subunit 3